MTTRRVVVCLPDGAQRVDPGSDETTKREVELGFEWNGVAAGVVGFGEGGRHALEIAAANPGLVGRLVLVSTEPTDDAPIDIPAKTLLLYGSLDGGHRRASWWKDRIGGRIEIIPREGNDILERVWPRVLSHLAPRSGR